MIPDLISQKQDILKNFNFDLVHMIMSTACRAVYDNNGKPTGFYEPWTYYYNRVPSIAELKQVASDLLDDVIKNNDINKVIWTGTGGFKAVNRYGILNLMFILEEWQCD